MTSPLYRLDCKRRDLAARYWPFARKTAGPFKKRWPALADEFDSAVAEALIRCARRYDGRVNFALYARPRLAGACLDVLRLAAKSAKRLPIVQEPVGDRPGVEDPVAEAEDREARLRACARVEALLLCLTPRQRRIIRWSILRGRTTTETARRIGLSQSRVVGLRKAVMDELREIAGTG